MNYYGELPSYCKGLRKCPVDGLENIKDDVFFNSQCKHKMHSLFAYQSPNLPS